jgi:phosphoserine phosphatase RsbU/P
MPRDFFDEYTRDLTSTDFQRLFTRETPDAYRFFARPLDLERLAGLPWYQRWPKTAQLVFKAFTMRLSPARRVLYALAMAGAVVGMLILFNGIGSVRMFFVLFSIRLPAPTWVDGTLWLFAGFVAVNLLLLMEVADRLSLKSELEIARDIQLAMLPGGTREAGDARIAGFTRPANTVGGDFYDVLTLPDGRLVLAIGDVAGKGSPAALLMALLLAMLRTLVDENFEAARLVTRLNIQVARHSPRSRFITLFYGVYDPRDGSLSFVNAGHLPPLLLRGDGRIERIGTESGGLALGMFDHATYAADRVVIAPGDLLVLYTDGLTEAENPQGRAFEESGLESVIRLHATDSVEALGRALLRTVEAWAQDVKLADDLTTLILKR